MRILLHQMDSDRVTFYLHISLYGTKRFVINVNVVRIEGPVIRCAYYSFKSICVKALICKANINEIPFITSILADFQQKDNLENVTCGRLYQRVLGCSPMVWSFESILLFTPC